MFRPSRALPTLLCLFALAMIAGVAGIAAPAAAQPHGPIVVNPSILLKTVTVVGAGETLELALANALAAIRTEYFVLSYTTDNPLCSDIPSFLIATQNQEPPVQFCSIEVTARVFRKALWIKD